MLELSGANTEAEPDLFLNFLLKQVFARLAVTSVDGVSGPEAAYLRGQARFLANDTRGGVDAFYNVVGGAPGPEADAARIFGAEFDGKETVEIASVLRGYGLFRLGQKAEAEKAWKEALSGGLGPLATARLAALQADVGTPVPLENPEKAVQSALQSVRDLRTKMAGLEGAEVISALLDARETRIGLDAARVARKAGKFDRALDRLDQVQQKKQGNRANFVNPPSYLVELSRAYADVGQYAPAVEIMFSMSNEFPSSRLVYESLKRLYASKTGGEAPPH
jgi:tetratricopeptide (TPR) repeat protein